jgi:hypothetical protein
LASGISKRSLGTDRNVDPSRGTIEKAAWIISVSLMKRVMVLEMRLRLICVTHLLVLLVIWGHAAPYLAEQLGSVVAICRVLPTRN